MLCPKCGKGVDERSSSCTHCGTTLDTGQYEEFAGPELPRSRSMSEVKSRTGRKAQVGGGMVLLLGVLLLATLGPDTKTPGDPHKLALAFVMIGLFLLIAGTIGRWFYLD